MLNPYAPQDWWILLRQSQVTLWSLAVVSIAYSAAELILDINFLFFLAAGATGSMVVQIAKHIINCKKVIGIAGTDSKCKWVESLGADLCLNYKASDFEKKLTEATTPFADVYFDNTGGPILDFM